MIREGARRALWQAREVIAGALVLLAGLWVASQGGYLLVPFGGLVAAGGLALATLGWRRMRFAAEGDAPGVVTVDEAQISYMGPTVGGFVSLADLIEVRLVRMRGRRLWRLKQEDGQALLVPLDASGAEALFDAFSALPGLSTGNLVAAIEANSSTGPALVGAEVSENRLVWARKGKGISPR